MNSRILEIFQRCLNIFLWGISFSTLTAPMAFGTGSPSAAILEIDKPHNVLIESVDENLRQVLSDYFTQTEISSRYKISIDEITELLRELENIDKFGFYYVDGKCAVRLSFPNEKSLDRWFKHGKISETVSISLLESFVLKNHIKSNELWLGVDSNEVGEFESSLNDIRKSRRYQLAALSDGSNSEHSIVRFYCANLLNGVFAKNKAVSPENILSISGAVKREPKGGFVLTSLIRFAQPTGEIGELFSFGKDITEIEGWVPEDSMSYSSISMDFERVLRVFFKRVNGSSISTTWPFIRYSFFLRAVGTFLGSDVSSFARTYCTGRISWVLGSLDRSTVNFQTMATCYHTKSKEMASFGVKWLLEKSDKLEKKVYHGVVIAHQNATVTNKRVMDVFGNFADSTFELRKETPLRNADWCYFSLDNCFIICDSLNMAKSCIDTYKRRARRLSDSRRFGRLIEQRNLKGIYLLMTKKIVENVILQLSDDNVAGFYGKAIRKSMSNKIKLAAPGTEMMTNFTDVLIDLVPNIVVQVKETPDGVLVSCFGN